MASKNLEKFLEGTPFKLPVAGLNTIIQVAESVIDNRDSMATLLLPIGQRLRMTSEILVQQTHFETLYPTCQRFCSVLTQASSELEEMMMQGLLKRILEVDSHAADIEEIFKRVDEATKNFQLELTLAIIRHTDKIEENTEMIRLRDLKPVREATYAQVKHEQCTEGTREEIITRIMTWCKNTSPQCAPVYWLSGMAGTGKSTIAYTICQQLYGSNDDARRLGGSFFCSRQFGASRTRWNIIPTVSYELSISLPAFRQAILHAKADASPPPLKDHIHNLLFSPWAASMRIDPNRPRPPPIPPLVVVIDALDELENGEGSEFLAELIEQAREGDLRGLKFLVTTRRDPSIIQAGKSIPPDAVCRLEADSAFVEQDINRYLRTKLLDLDQDNLAELARHASGLFIYAATAVRFIIPPSLPKPAIITQKKCLELLLTSWPKRSQCGKDGLLVDHLYEEILDLWLSPMAEDNKPPSLSILQTVVCAEESVIISDIPQLLDRSENQMDVEEVQNLILSLHAVLYVSEGRVHSYHKSFVDFMFDKGRFTDATLAERVSVTSQRHYCLASSCFRIMSSLQFNMCQLPNSFNDDDKVGDLPNRIDDNISTALRYACRHWATHFSKIPENRQTNAMPMFQEWLEERWLFWMEAMNLIAAIGDCYYLLEMTRNSFVGQVFLDDIVAAQNLVLSFANDILKKSTPHLYVSALAASSRRSHLISLWCSKFPGIPIVTALKSKDSDSELLMVQHNDSVYAVSPSPHGRYLISSSEHRTVRLLEKATMEEVLPLDGSINRTRIRLIGFSGPSTPDTPLPESPRPGQQLRRLYRTASTGPKEKDPTSGDCCVDILTVVDGPKRIHPNKQNDALCSATHVSFSPDGSRIISASRNGALRTWDTETEQQTCRIDTHNGPVHSAVFSPDGTRILSASVEKTVRIWDSQTGRQLSCLEGHRDTVSSASFSPDEMAIVSASHDGIVHIWDTNTGKEIHRIDAHDGSVNCVCFSPDGKRIVSASDDSIVRIWDRRTGCQLYQLEGHIGSVPIASFSPDGKHVVSASSNGYIHTWYTTVVQEMLRIEAHDGGSVNLACVSPDGTRIVSASHDGALRIWDAETGSLVRCFNKAHEDLSAESVCFSPDGTRIVSASLNGIVRVLEVSTGTEIHHIIANISGGSVNSVSFSPGGTRFASASDDGTVCIWDNGTGHQIRLLKSDGSGSVKSLCFSPDGSRIVSASSKGFMDIWDTDTGHLIHHIEACIGVYANSAAFSPDGALIVSALHDGTVRVWDAGTGRQLYQLNGHTDSVSSASFSPDGKYIISASYDKTIRIWVYGTQHQLYKLDGHEDLVSSVGFTPDGTKIVSASYDRSVRIWHTPTAKLIHRIPAHDGPVNSVGYSRDATYILSASSKDYTVKIWDTESGHLVRRIDHNSWVLSASYSLDGVYIVSAMHDGTIRISDATSGQALRLLDIREKSVSTEDFTTPNAASGSNDNTGRRANSENEPVRLDVEQILSSLEKAEYPSRLTISTTLGRGNMYARWRRHPDGWITSPDNERYIWISGDMHHLLSPEDSLVQASNGLINIDFTNSHLGPDWDQCYYDP